MRSKRRPALDTVRPARSRAPHLRPYQVEAQQAILEHRARGVRTQLVSLATGLGTARALGFDVAVTAFYPDDALRIVARANAFKAKMAAKK